MNILAKGYASPTVILLALDIDTKPAHNFLGFAIQRKPGFDGASESWLPNRINFNGPAEENKDFDSDQAPVQSFQWWDARINTEDRGNTFVYTIHTVMGTPQNFQNDSSKQITVRVPEITEHKISTYFNRAVVSSQAFSAEFPALNTTALQIKARAWLANGIENAIPDFLKAKPSADIEGAIYHLTDKTWIIPALQDHPGKLSLCYNHTGTDTTSDDAIQELVSAGRDAAEFSARTKANIMHNKFLVRVNKNGEANAVLAGSMNFTPEAESVQANLLHVFESPELAALYLERKHFLENDPSRAATREEQKGWSKSIAVGDANIRVYFPPEPTSARVSIDTIVDAIDAAKSSVLLCAFDPTDKELLDAIKRKADQGIMVYGLVNRVPASAEPHDSPKPAEEAAIDIISLSNDGFFTGFSAFKTGDVPTGFKPERVLWPNENPKIMVRIHHKFVVIDGETSAPIIYTGSANFSNNSMHNNDENMLEIKNCPRVAAIYLAEFLRLFGHYRARAAFNADAKGEKKFALTPDNAWTKKYFAEGSPTARSRIAMAKGGK